MTRVSHSAAIPEDLRRHNRARVLDLLSRYGTLSRTALARHTRLTSAAVSRISKELVNAGIVAESSFDARQTARGRPAVALTLSANGGFVVGIGIGAYEQRVQLTNLQGRCISQKSLDLLVLRSPGRAVSVLAHAIRRLVKHAGVAPRSIFGAGVAVAGVVEHGSVLQSPNIGWADVPLAEKLERALGVPVVVESMHHAMNLAEARQGAARGIAHSVLVNAALGIGSSVMEEGRIVRGKHFAAGQIGHMRVAGATELCTCGRRGCLDTVASGYAVLRRLGRRPRRVRPGQHHTADAHQLLRAIEREGHGDKAAQAAFRVCGEALGEALNAVRAILDPDRVVLAGPLAGAASYVEGVRTKLEAPMTGHDSAPFLYLAGHSSDSAAAWLALSQLVFGPALTLKKPRR